MPQNVANLHLTFVNPPLTFSKSADEPGFLMGTLPKKDTNLELILF